MNNNENVEGANFIKDREEARVVADAERPVRDLAREAGVDDETKRIFDKRAEQRGQMAQDRLNVEKQERLQLVNPELQKLKQEIALCIQQYKELLGDDTGITPMLRSYGFSSEGVLNRITINGLIYSDGKPVGPLGTKLQAEAKRWLEALKAKNGSDMRLNEDNNDQFILDAYNADPEVRSMIDEAISLTKRQYLAHEAIEKALRDKEKYYEDVNNINAFLQKAGFSGRIPDHINLRELANSSSELFYSGAENRQQILENAESLSSVLQAFKDLKIEKSRLEDLSPDLDIISKRLSPILYRITDAYEKASPKNDSSVIFYTPVADLLKKTGKVYTVGE